MFKMVIILLCLVLKNNCDRKQVYKIGGLFGDDTHSIAFRVATGIVNEKYDFSQIELEPISTILPIHNALLAYNSACKLLQDGIIGLFGPSSTHSSTYIQALCDTKELIHFETHQELKMENDKSVVNLHPYPKVFSNLFYDLIKVFDWHSFIILYDTDENFLLVSSVIEFNSQGRTVVLRQLEVDENYEADGFRPMLTKVKHTGETKFLLSCATNILEQVLKELQQVGMMTDVYSYIVANLDMQTIELQPFQYAGTNITGVRMIDPERLEVISTAGEIQRKRRSSEIFEALPVVAAWKMKLETALIVDAVHLFYKTIYSMAGDNNKCLSTKPISCQSQENLSNGLSIMNLMKSENVEGLTGLVKFDEGFRKDFTIDLLELTPGGLVNVGTWNSTARLFKFTKSYESLNTKQENLFNRTFSVLISMSPPYAMLKETTTQLVGNDRYEGYCVDLIEKLAKILKFNYTFEVQEDGANGNFNGTHWTGMIGKVVDRKVDLAITDLTITSDREKAVDFTMPFMNLGISILYKKPEPVPPSLFMFASPFSILVWVMLGVSYFVVSIAIFVMGRLAPAEWQNPFPCIEEPEYLVNQFTIRNSLWFTIGALMQQGSELAPVAISTRTASGVWWFFVLIMVSSYTANLAAFLTVETLVTPFKNITELATHGKIKYGAKLNGATANYFRDSNKTEYQAIWKYMVHNPKNMMSDNDEGVKKVENENYAFLMESTSIEYVTERHCTLAQVGGLLDDKGYGIAMVKDSPYRNELSRAVLRLQETGVLTSLKIKWWKEKRGGGKCSRKSEGGEATPLDLQNVGGVFLVLSVGSLLGFIGSFLELVLHVYRKCKSKKLHFKEEFKREMKFFVEFKSNTKEVSDTNSVHSNESNITHKTKVEFGI